MLDGVAASRPLVVKQQVERRCDSGMRFVDPFDEIDPFRLLVRQRAEARIMIDRNATQEETALGIESEHADARMVAREIEPAVP